MGFFGGVWLFGFFFTFPEELSKGKMCWIDLAEYGGLFINCSSVQPLMFLSCSLCNRVALPPALLLNHSAITLSNCMFVTKMLVLVFALQHDWGSCTLTVQVVSEEC